jgi:hypothetical protein
MNVHLPTLILNILSPFSQLFSASTWKKAQFLCVGAILCQGARRISSILHVMGMAHNKGFEKYCQYALKNYPLIALKIYPPFEGCADVNIAESMYYGSIFLIYFTNIKFF